MVPGPGRGRPEARLGPPKVREALGRGLAAKLGRGSHNAPMSTFEIMGMVFGTVGLSLGTLGLIFSVAALRKINELEARLAKEAPRED